MNINNDNDNNDNDNDNDKIIVKKIWIRLDNIHKELCVDIKLKKNIDKLPPDIQKKICIYTWKEFWRDYIPLTAKIPSWYSRKIKIEKVLLDSKLNNIHFLHLPFNTLKENKKWIMGCQCDYCKYYEKNNKDSCIVEYKKQYENESYYYSKKLSGYSSSKWTDLYYTISSSNQEIPLLGYDPLFGSDYEDYNKWAIRNPKDNELYFS